MSEIVWPSPYLDNRVSVERFGFKLTLNPNEAIDHELLEGREWDLGVGNLLRRVVRDGMTVVDVGAGIGWFTLLLSRLVGPTGFVYAFEPMDEPRLVLQGHLVANGVQNAQAIAAALWNRDEPAALMNVAYSSPRDGSPPLNRANVASRWALDNISGLTTIGVMKIDTDGREWQVLRGAEGILRRDRPAIVLELSDWTLWRFSDAYDGVRPYERGRFVPPFLEWLASFGYRFRSEHTPEVYTTAERLMSDTAYDLAKGTVNILAEPIS